MARILATKHTSNTVRTYDSCQVWYEVGSPAKTRREVVNRSKISVLGSLLLAMENMEIDIRATPGVADK